MAAGLPEVIDDLEDVESKVQQFYDKQDDGSFKLTTIDGLRNAKNREKEEKKRYKELASNYEKKFSGFSDEEMEELINIRETKKAEEIRNLEDKRQWEALKRRMEENHTRQIKDIEEEKKRNWDLLEGYVRDDHLKSALSERGVSDTGRQLLPKILKDRIGIRLEDGNRPSLEFFDEYGQPQVVNGKNEDYTLDDFMEEVSSQYDDLFLGPNKSGTGAAISARHAAKMKNLPSAMSPAEKARYVSEYGPESFKQLVKIELEKKRQSQQDAV